MRAVAELNESTSHGETWLKQRVRFRGSRELQRVPMQLQFNQQLEMNRVNSSQKNGPREQAVFLRFGCGDQI